jgi:hypothetical protein
VLYACVFWHGEAESLELRFQPERTTDPPPESLAGGFLIFWGRVSNSRKRRNENVKLQAPGSIGKHGLGGTKPERA